MHERHGPTVEETAGAEYVYVIPRDAINIAAQAAMLAQSDHISVPHVRAAARKWFEQDKESALQSKQEAIDQVNWVVDEVISGERARGFLINQREAGNDLLMELRRNGHPYGTHNRSLEPAATGLHAPRSAASRCPDGR